MEIKYSVVDIESDCWAYTDGRENYRNKDDSNEPIIMIDDTQDCIQLEMIAKIWAIWRTVKSVYGWQ